MRCAPQPREPRYIKGYGFLSFARKFIDRYGKKLTDTATKAAKNVGIDGEKTASKKLF